MLLPRPPGLHIRGLRVPLGAALAGSKRDAYLWPETFVTTLAVGYHVVTPQQTRSGSFADFPSRWDTPRSCFEARGGWRWENGYQSFSGEVSTGLPW